MKHVTHLQWIEHVIPAEYQSDFEAMPPALRALLVAEIAAGNRIVEVGHSHPAPPAGAYFLLAHAVTTRARASRDGLRFRERNSSLYSGEFTDERRFFFILEPPRLPEPAPDMNAIRAALARQGAADAARFAAGGSPREANEAQSSANAAMPSRVERFKASMQMDYERWREGTSYDLALLAEATADERRQIEHLLLTHEVRDWRDVEALAALDTTAAQTALRNTLASGSIELAVSVLRFAPSLLTMDERVDTLVRAVEHADFYSGLTQALLQIQAFHPPAVIDALLRGILHRSDGAQVHFAALLLFLHGKSKAPFDWEQRPYFLKFNTNDPEERKALFNDLCARIQLRAGGYIGE